MRDIKMFSDFSCPFCYIGFSIIDKLRQEEDIVFTHIPILLNPNETLEGSTLDEHVDKDHIKTSYERIESLGSEYGLIYNNKYNRFNTNRLHKAALYSAEKGKFFEFSKLSFETIFKDGKNVGLKETINSIGKKVNLNIDDMNKEIDSGKYNNIIKYGEALSKEKGVTSVPTFIVDGNIVPTRLEPYDDFKNQLLR